VTDDSTSFADLRQVTVVLRDDDDMRIRKNRADAGSASSGRRLPLHDHRSTRAVGFVSVLLFAIPVISSSMFLRMPK